MTDRSLRLTAETSVLCFIDLQERLMPAIHDEAAVLQRARLVGFGAQQCEVPIVGTEQNPDKLGPLMPAFPEMSARVLDKMHFDACAGGLLDVIDEVAPSARQIVLAGCEAHVCLLQTALGVLESGREAWIVADACGSRDPRDYHAAMDRLRHAGATVITAEMAVFEWLGTADHPHFRDMSRQIKEPRFPSEEP
ncbi:MAG: isochorismatase family protein [Mobilicoccus sp.]|nr:isochorismatase family protein [Mobilicoccus sp.]